MGMIICRKHSEQVISFVSVKLKDAILNDSVPNDNEVLLIVVRDIAIPDLDFAYQGWNQDHQFLMARNEQSNIMDIDELNQLAVPICPKCRKEYVQKHNLSEKSTDEIHFIFTE
jgi:hypothetical protein